jgi:restriction system protein
LERKLFDWMSRRSDWVLATLPFLVFFVLVASTVTAISLLAGRSPIGDVFAEWIIVGVSASALALYVVWFYAVAAVFIRTGRFKLLELHQSMRDIRAMSWRQFEELVAASYQARGYEIEQRGGYEPDGGVDLIVRKSGRAWLVQCKHYRNDWIGEPPLRDLLGAVTARRADGGILVGCGGFDKRAQAFAKMSGKLELVDGEQLRELIAQSVAARASSLRATR